MSPQSSFHQTVLLNELVDALCLKSGDVAIDCTVGAGGHTEKMLEKVGESGQVLGIDQDDRALGITAERLASAVKSNNLTLTKGRFSTLAQVVESHGLTGQVAAICADIGVSSMHLNEVERGFSFQGEGPLDMRMDQKQRRTAADLIATEDLDSLIKIFRDYGEEPKAKQIAKRIVQTREATPIVTTKQLADLVKAAAAYPTASRKHPATRVFQALRIAVNDELGELRTLLASALAALKPGGRLAIISFHSLEDRIVKQAFVDFTGKRDRSNIPRDLPIKAEAIDKLVNARATIIKPFPLVPTEAETAVNQRSRSAKMRVLQKL